MLSNEWDNKFAFAKGTWYFQTLPKKHVVHSGFDTNLVFGHITKGLLGCGINCGKPFIHGRVSGSNHGVFTSSGMLEVSTRTS